MWAMVLTISDSCSTCDLPNTLSLVTRSGHEIPIS